MTTQAIPASGEKPLRHDVPITVAELARQQLGTEDLERLKGESSLLRQLRLAEKLLDDAKKSQPARSEFLIELEANLRAALRAVEANHYAQSVSRRFGDVIEPIQKLIDQIRAAHTTHCTCQN